VPRLTPLGALTAIPRPPSWFKGALLPSGDGRGRGGKKRKAVEEGRRSEGEKKRRGGEEREKVWM